MSDTPKVDSVPLPSAGYRPVRVADMTLEQAREAIQVLGEDIARMSNYLDARKQMKEWLKEHWKTETAR